jgi:hypothetical protein
MARDNGERTAAIPVGVSRWNRYSLRMVNELEPAALKEGVASQAFIPRRFCVNTVSEETWAGRSTHPHRCSPGPPLARHSPRALPYPLIAVPHFRDHPAMGSISQLAAVEFPVDGAAAPSSRCCPLTADDADPKSSLRPGIRLLPAAAHKAQDRPRKASRPCLDVKPFSRMGKRTARVRI